MCLPDQAPAGRIQFALPYDPDFLRTTHTAWSSVPPASIKSNAEIVGDHADREISLAAAGLLRLYIAIAAPNAPF